MGGVLWYKLVVYIVLSCQEEGILLQNYRARSGRCLAMLFKSIRVRGRFDSPDKQRWSSDARAGATWPLTLQPLLLVLQIAARRSQRFQLPSAPKCLPNKFPKQIFPSCNPFFMTRNKFLKWSNHVSGHAISFYRTNSSQNKTTQKKTISEYFSGHVTHYMISNNSRKLLFVCNSSGAHGIRPRTSKQREKKKKNVWSDNCFV